MDRRKKKGHYIDQKQAIEEVLEKHGMTEANPIRVPISEVELIEGDNELLKEKTLGLHRVSTIKDF